MFRLRKYEGGHYVAKKGSYNSYTNTLKYARNFPTREEAEADRCVESEYIEEDNS